MDAAAFEQVYGSFRDFHAYFAPLFGRRETREHSGHYLQALLVQSGERRNAENLSETVPGSARGMQRFLTDSPWDDEVIIGRLQEYLGTRLEHPEGVWVLDGSDFPKQGRKSVGVARQYCGRLGKVANCQAGMFLAYVSPLGRALVDKGLYLPESWTSDKDRCEAAGVPEDRQGYRSKTELALEMMGRAQERGHLKAGWVAADDAFGMSPSFREGLAALGMWYVLDVPSGFTVWPPEPAWTSAEYQGFGRPRKPRLRDGQRRTMEQRSDELPEEAWREITVAEGSQGPRSYLFSAQRVRPTSRRKPGEIHWAVYRRNRDGSEPRYYLSNAPEDTPLETLAYVGGSRWRIETEFETEKSDVGLDEYETRTSAGWHHHVALCLLGAGSLLSLQQAWGEKDAPDHEAAGPKLPGGRGNAAPGTVRTKMVGRAQERGQVAVACGENAFGMSPSFREGLAALGTVRAGTGFTVWPPEPAWTTGSGIRASPLQTQAEDGQRRTWSSAATSCPGGRTGANAATFSAPRGWTDPTTSCCGGYLSKDTPQDRPCV